MISCNPLLPMWRHSTKSSCSSCLHFSPIILRMTSVLHARLHQKSPLQWLHNGRDSVSNHQPHDCWPNRLFRRRSKKTSKLRVIGLCVGNSAVTGEFPAQMASNGENLSIWWRHHAILCFVGKRTLYNSWTHAKHSGDRMQICINLLSVHSLASINSLSTACPDKWE